MVEIGRQALPRHQRTILAIIRDAGEGGATAMEIAKVYSPSFAERHARSAVGSARGVATELVRKGLAAKSFRRRELLAYHVTEAGRSVLEEPTKKG